MKNLLFIVFLLHRWVGSAEVQAQTEDPFQMSGIIEKISANSLILDKGGERFEFAIDSTDRFILKDFQPGDEVSIQYIPVVKKIRHQERSRSLQRPGKPLEKPRKGYPILDDRAVFLARDKAKSEENFSDPLLALQLQTA